VTVKKSFLDSHRPFLGFEGPPPQRERGVFLVPPARVSFNPPFSVSWSQTLGFTGRPPGLPPVFHATIFRPPRHAPRLFWFAGAPPLPPNPCPGCPHFLLYHPSRSVFLALSPFAGMAPVFHGPVPPRRASYTKTFFLCPPRPLLVGPFFNFTPLPEGLGNCPKSKPHSPFPQAPDPRRERPSPGRVIRQRVGLSTGPSCFSFLLSSNHPYLFCPLFRGPPVLGFFSTAEPPTPPKGSGLPHVFDTSSHPLFMVPVPATDSCFIESCWLFLLVVHWIFGLFFPPPDLSPCLPLCHPVVVRTEYFHPRNSRSLFWFFSFCPSASYLPRISPRFTHPPPSIALSRSATSRCSGLRRLHHHCFSIPESIADCLCVGYPVPLSMLASSFRQSRGKFFFQPPFFRVLSQGHTHCSHPNPPKPPPTREGSFARDPPTVRVSAVKYPSP